ncbi:MAG TPA: DNA-3-methyladenine glycosylase [Paenalcaligenes hominis]|uniref:Putative 3-methyladenine DNA glycosylase n=1 Tax=Paenalcaligenes hominis TaxID=643674 RepID=A0A9D3ABL6_9BURK|nr:DNA-3-methyladenine glycosylase [Paenalcaligenes hominis]NJB66266.1 DNA-3-methyladenine glycosylase [Paenalcaligenes hominis]GGE74472.1 putative 3-methyladenine DNA glycosylase [Paenalcaligenes hominis]HJH24846.1 DNA-3-methyladenine glycosylase [Paenalcaligenes hominis]
MSKLERDFYANPNCAEVAHGLIGKTLVVHKPGQPKRVGRIVETEAYLGPHDLAAHSSKGVTARTQVMFGEPGYVYVYLIYGMHHCMNLVSGPVGSGSGVLLRGLEPIEGITLPTNGPGRLCKALGITRADYGTDACGKHIYVLDTPLASGEQVEKSPRIGVDYAGDWAHELLRFSMKDSPYVSKPPKLKPPK